MDLKFYFFLLFVKYVMVHILLHQFTKNSGNFLLPLGLESAFENAPFGGSSEGLHDHYPSIPKYPAAG